MMPAAKHGDPQLGVDIHYYTTPAGPEPVPMPALHLSIVFDPFDYVPIIGSTVTVCGMQRANAGTGGLVIHIPFGFPFAPEFPQLTDQLFMGSSTVVADGEPFSYLGMPVLGCQIVGMLSPPRLRHKATEASLLPTTVNLAIPTNVFVGGPPTINMQAFAMTAAFKALGKLRKTKLAKYLGDRLTKVRQKLFKNMDASFLKCKVLRAEPVNILSGEVSVEQSDFTLAGRLPIEWVRQYRSGSARKGACGHGWETLADARLEIDAEDGSVTFHHPGEAPALFPELPASPGASGAVLELLDGAQLSDHGEELRVRTKADQIYHFSKALLSVGAEGSREIPLTRVSDLCDNWLEFERHGEQLAAIRETAGRRLVLEYENGLVKSVSLYTADTGFSHRFVEYGYDPEENLTTVRDELGSPYTFAYDRHHMVRHTNRTDLSFYYDYERSDEDWRVVHAWGDGGLYDYRFVYAPLLNERRITDSRGNVSIVHCNEWNLPILEIDPLDGRTIFEYDAAGRTTAVVDPAHHRTEFSYDERGNLVQLTRADGSAIQIEFDEDSHPRRLTDPNGNVWRQTWDSRGLLTERRSPLGSVTRFEYDASGLPIRRTDGNGAVTSLDFDGYGFLVGVTDALGNASRWRRDELGNILAATDPLGRTTTYRYDTKSRLIESTLPAGAVVRYGYDAQDLLTHYIDQNGAQTRFEYFGLGLLSKRYQPDGHVLQYEYDTEEQLIAVINQRGERYELERDSLGRVVREIDYFGCATAFRFDAAGYLEQKRDPLGQTIDYKTDELGRIRRKRFAHPFHPGDPDRHFEETFDFDANGNLTGCANEHVQVQRRYDAEDRLIEERQNGFTVKYAFDKLGRRIRRETKDHAVAYEYDSVGRVSAIGIDDEAPILLQRDAAGQVLREMLGPKLERHYGYDEQGRLTRQSVKRGADDLFQTHFEYDPTGNLIERRDSGFGIERYRYDPLGQVVEHIDPAGRLKRFFHDPAGDRLVTSVADPKEMRRDVERDRWRRVGGFEHTLYRFDASGALTERFEEKPVDPAYAGHAKLTTFEWDANQRLVRSRAQKSGSGELQADTFYGYDPLGRRVLKIANGASTWFGWDEDTLLAEGPAERSRNTVVTSASVERTKIEKAPKVWRPDREYVYYPDDPFVPLAVVDHTGSYCYHNDPNGCPTRLTRRDGSVVWAARHDVWGEAQIQVEEIKNPLRLQGQYNDAETGLHYNRFRYFDPSIGRFISADPLGLEAGADLYQYAANIWSWIDPFGLECKRGPKPGLQGPHNQKIREIADELEAAGHTILAGGKRERAPGNFLPEAVIATPGGVKATRRPDILYEDAVTGQRRAINVGRTKADGSPVTREQHALNDLRNKAKLPTDFRAYDK